MDSKTPSFDKALDEILKDVHPHTRTCAWKEKSPYCEKDFNITKEDIEFYHILRVPPPTLCPTCRRQRRLSFVNQFYFYKRKCEVPGHDERVISFVPPNKKLTVYDWEYYRTYKWDLLSPVVAYDAGEPFFETLYKLRECVPQPAIVRSPTCINSDYTINGRNLKNGYYVSGGWNSENISYSVSVTIGSRDCIDCFTVSAGNQCYENVLTKNCYRCTHAYFSKDCINSSFLYDCRNCQDCFGAVNLRNKRYVFFGEQLSE